VIFLKKGLDKTVLPMINASFLSTPSCFSAYRAMSFFAESK